MSIVLDGEEARLRARYTTLAAEWDSLNGQLDEIKKRLVAVEQERFDIERALDTRFWAAVLGERR